MVQTHRKLRIFANCGWYRGGLSFVPNVGRRHYFLYTVGRSNFLKQQLELIKQQALSALDEATTPASLEELRVHRRALHRIPEVGENEYKTQAYILNHLRALNPDDLRVFADTGVRAVFRGNRKGRVVAFRSDIDALPVK